MRFLYKCLIAAGLLVQLAATAWAQIGNKVKAATGPNAGITGLWRNSAMGFNMDLDLKAGGKGSFDAESITYQFTGTTLVVTTQGQKTTYQAKLSGNRLTLSGGDLDAAITFERVTAEGATVPGGQPGSTTLAATAAGAVPAALQGAWVAPNEEISFNANGKMNYNGIPLDCQVEGNQITLQTPNGPVAFTYTLSGNQLTMQNGTLNAVYTRKQGGAAQGGTAMAAPGRPSANAAAAEGIIDPTLVGKWSYVGTANNISGTFSNEEYITLNADGTYEYYSETSGTARGTDQYGTQVFAGGVASNSADRGTWRVKGNTIIGTSAKTGTKVYTLEKRNHPKTGDPMIILDGTAYVTYYQKAPWR